jgi:hypothetical protein
MNAERRKKLSEAWVKIADGLSLIEEVLSDEQEYYDNMPQSFQEGEKGQKAQDAVSELEGVVDTLQQVESSLETAAA